MPPTDDKSGFKNIAPSNQEATFYDEEQRILVNKLGLQDRAAIEKVEEEGLRRATAKLFDGKTFPTESTLTATTIRKAHREIFGELYEWAGKWRTLNIAKEQMRWPPAMLLEQNMQTLERDVLSKFRPKDLKNDSDFAKALAVIQGEFLAVHPFREGNARTIKLCTNLLALSSGRPILQYDSSEGGRKAYIDANKIVVSQMEYAPLEGIINDALRRAHTLQDERTQKPQLSTEDKFDRLAKTLKTEAKNEPQDQDQPQKQKTKIKR